jgi:hypothetical protein
MSDDGKEPPESTLDRIVGERRDKAAALRAGGADPFRNDVGPTVAISALRVRYEATKPTAPST